MCNQQSCVSLMVGAFVAVMVGGLVAESGLA